MDRIQEYKSSLIAVAAALVALLLSVIVVPETQQAVVVRFGEPVRVINGFYASQAYGQTGAGINLRIPFAERVERIDKRIMTVDMDPQQVLSTDQQRLNVDAFARFRIVDPVRMVKTAGTIERATEALEPILTSVLRQELGRRTFRSLLTAERGEAMERIRKGLDREAKQYGAEVVDVRIKQTDLPEGALQSAFSRMEAARNQQATMIKAEGQKQAQIIQGQAQARAAQIYADSFGKDPAFYDFYRAMQSYDTAFDKESAPTTILLSPDNEYLKQFRGK